MQAFEAENKAFRENPPLGKDLVRWKYQRYMRNYLSCVAGGDRNIGRVLDRLDALQLSEHTLRFTVQIKDFTLGEHGWFDKRWAYEESLKMPLIMRWPGKIKAGYLVPRLLSRTLIMLPLCWRSQASSRSGRCIR